MVTDLQNSVEKARVLRSMRDLSRIFGELIAYAMLFISPRDTAVGRVPFCRVVDETLNMKSI